MFQARLRVGLMIIRPVFLIPALVAASLLAGCSKTGEQKDASATPTPSAAAPATAALVAEAQPGDQAPPVANTPSFPLDAAALAAEHARAEREAELRLKASADEARAAFAEIELKEQTARALAQQQLATQMEAARAAQLADQARALSFENAALRARALENEQRAIEAERAAYGVPNTVIVVQPPQRYGYGGPNGRPPRPGPPRHEPPPQGAGVANLGVLQPAIPNLTPPGPPATFGPSSPQPRFDTMRTRKRPVNEAQTAP